MRSLAGHHLCALALASLASLASLACPAAGPSSATPDASALAPPVAKRVPRELVAHGHARVDDYYWLRERDDPEVLAYLEAENAYAERATAHTAELRARLLDELRGRVVERDSTPPVRERDYLYYERWVEGAEHPLHCRRHAREGAPEEILLDADALAAAHDYFELAELELSESQQLMAYSVDTLGRRFYTILVQDLRSGEALSDAIPDTTGELEWANDDRTLFYVKQDPSTLRADRIYRHTLGEPASADALVHAEPDPTFELGLWKTRSRAYLVFDAYSTLTDEVWVLPAAEPTAAPRVIQPRVRGLEYGVDHLGDFFYLRTNLEAENFRLMRTPVDAPTRDNWVELVPHRSEVLVEGFELFADHLVVEQRARGLTQLEIRGLDGREGHQLEFADPAYLAYTSDNVELDTATLRYSYSSMTTPQSIFDYDMNTRAQTLVKRREIRGGFAAQDYVSARLDARARDGAAVPISLVHRRDTPIDGSAPLLVYAYGAYGSSEDASFSSAVLSLLDRGFVYAIAHVRGGEELGRGWYEGGKLLAKINSFTDFIDSAEFLVAEGYGDRARVFAEGGSAGGLLVGAVINMRPDLFAGAVAEVPFVDVVTTMLDPTIPLTTSEYDEWGDPSDPKYYHYMLSYSPYDNVEAKAYPALLVTAGLHDSQVQYWEPAKWVAKLRATKTDANSLLLRTDMSAGHGGKSGRLASYEDLAFVYAFLLDLARASGAQPG